MFVSIIREVEEVVLKIEEEVKSDNANRCIRPEFPVPNESDVAVLNGSIRSDTYDIEVTLSSNELSKIGMKREDLLAIHGTLVKSVGSINDSFPFEARNKDCMTV